MIKRLLWIAMLVFGSLCIRAQSDTLWVAPNPCDTATTIYFGLANQDSITLLCTDATGKTRKMFYSNALLAAGNYVLQYSTDSLPNGVYFLSLTSKQVKRVAKLIKAKGTGLEDWTSTPRILQMPNFVTNTLQILDNRVERVVFFDINGQLLFTTTLQNNSINVSRLPMGTYFIQSQLKSGEYLKPEYVFVLRQ